MGQSAWKKADDIAGAWLFLPKRLSLNEEQKRYFQE
jgi:hypothetical protein